MSQSPITIAHLREAPDALPVCAQWINETWGHDMGHELGETVSWLGEVIAPESGEAAFVAQHDGTPVGVCLLVACDLEQRADLTPWVAGLYVLPSHRHGGIATRLLGAVEDEARSMAAPNLYLYSKTAVALYTRLGWEAMEQVTLGSRTFTLMRKVL